MTWFKVDDSFHANPKVLAASPAALGLWVVAGSWSAQNLTEGFVPNHVLARLMPRADRFATELIKVGLWERAENGYQFHDWTDFNPTRSEALAVKERQSSGGSVGNHRRWHEAKGKVDPACRYCRNGHRPTDRSTDQSTESVANRPSRPDPTRRVGGSIGESSTGSGRAREDDDFDQKIADMLHAETGKAVPLEWAARVRRQILSGRAPDDPLAYVAAAIRGEPRRFLPTNGDPSSRSLAEALAAARGES
ncbi:MAG TPA: hypothetical protein VF174_02095 [Micromonosporaceae bacterium]